MRGNVGPTRDHVAGSQPIDVKGTISKDMTTASARYFFLNHSKL